MIGKHEQQARLELGERILQFHRKRYTSLPLTELQPWFEKIEKAKALDAKGACVGTLVAMGDGEEGLELDEFRRVAIVAFDSDDDLRALAPYLLQKNGIRLVGT